MSPQVANLKMGIHMVPRGSPKMLKKPLFIGITCCIVISRSTSYHTRSAVQKAVQMAKIAFSDLGVRSFKPGLYYDTRTRGFGMRVGQRRRTWFVIKGKKAAKVRLGHYPALSLADARKRALVALGTPYEPSVAPSFIEARDQYLKQGTWRPKFRYQITRWLHLYFSWTKPIDQITPHDVMLVIDAIKKPAEANHAFQSIRALFAWCVPRYLKHSPSVGLRAPRKSTPRSRVLSDEELGRIWRACEQPGECATKNTRIATVRVQIQVLPRLPASYCTIVKLLIITGQRRGEIAALQSSWITHTPHMSKIVFPASVTKNGREHSLPISSRTLKLATSHKPFTDWSRAKAVLDKISGVQAWTLHDLRRTYASRLAALGVRIEVIERILNHVSGSFSGVVGTYNRHDYWSEQVEAVAKFDAWFRTLISGNHTRT